MTHAAVNRSHGAWHSIGDRQKYVSSASGEVLGKDGGVVIVRSRQSLGEAFAGELQSVHVSDVSGKQVTLSAKISVRGSPDRSGIFIRADGDRMPLAFASSYAEPVRDGEGEVIRTVHMDLPSKTVNIAFGAILKGQGSMSAVALRARVDTLPPDVRDVSPEVMVNAATEILRHHALRAQSVDWGALSRIAKTELAGAAVAADAYPVIRHMLVQLGDKHSNLVSRFEAGDLETQGASAAPVIVTVEDCGVGYIGMPGYRGFAHDKAMEFVADTATRIAKVSPRVTRGWIVDLRQDTGGNMWPMLASLRALLGPGQIGGFKSPDSSISPWVAGDGIGNWRYTGPDLSAMPVALLIGRRTNSAGEAVAIAFHGRPNTKSFGSPTSGRSTANRSFKLPDGSMIFLTTAVDVDREGEAFGESVMPDVRERSEGDRNLLEVARAWVVAQGEHDGG